MTKQTTLIDRLRELEAAELDVANSMDMRPEDTANWRYAQTAREAREAIERWSAAEPKATLGGIPFVFVEDPDMPPDQIELRGSNGQRVRVVNLKMPDSWCPHCRRVLANDEIIGSCIHNDGAHRRAENRGGDER